MVKQLHVISFDVPYPPDYGGIIDVYYKLKKLNEKGVRIHLHAFKYKGHNSPNSVLEELCESVSYYSRKSNPLLALFDNRPYIVSSRCSKELINNLLKNDYPILLEGLHTCGLLRDGRFSNRIKLVRAHNIEHEYYAELAALSGGLKKIYYQKESKRLQQFEKILSKANCIFSIAQRDVAHFAQYSEAEFLPAFFNDAPMMESVGAKKNYVLYHGNLEVKENQYAAEFLVKELEGLNIKLIIAGKSPSDQLMGLKNDTVQIIPNPSNEELEKLISEAWVNVFAARKPAGVKLKVLNALQLGGHVLMSRELDDQGLFEGLAEVVERNEIGGRLKSLMETPFSQELHLTRMKKFRNTFNLDLAVQQIINRI